MSIVEVKILAALAILAMGILGGIVPLAAARHGTRRRLLSFGNALAGGIFLGAGFIHLLPEAGEALKEVVDYPLAPLVASLGIGLLLLIDRVVFEFIRSEQTAQTKAVRQPIFPLVLLVALSVHSIIAGIALGVQPELAHSVLVMIGILFHKGSAAFALIVSAQASGADRSMIRTVLAIFVSMTPIGIVLGMSASGLLHGSAAMLVVGGFSALAAGTFIYVAIMDIIGSELSRFEDRVHRFVGTALKGDGDAPMPTRDKDRSMKFVLVIAGLASMAILAIWM